MVTEQGHFVGAPVSYCVMFSLCFWPGVVLEYLKMIRLCLNLCVLRALPNQTALPGKKCTNVFSLLFPPQSSLVSNRSGSSLSFSNDTRFSLSFFL